MLCQWMCIRGVVLKTHFIGTKPLLVRAALLDMVLLSSPTNILIPSCPQISGPAIAHDLTMTLLAWSFKGENGTDIEQLCRSQLGRRL